jgi:DNA-binding MarR family transcriptional regulator
MVTSTDRSMGANPCIATAMRKASRRLSQLYDAFMAPSGLRSTQFAILSELERQAKHPPTVGELAEILVMDRSALGHTLRPLERDGLLIFGRDEDDRRRRPIMLTADGRSALVGARPLWKQAQAHFAKLYGTKSMAALRETLLDLASDDRLSTTAQ